MKIPRAATKTQRSQINKTTLMDFKCVILGKLDQRQRKMLYDSNYMWNLKNKTSECNKKNRFIDTGSR